MTTHFDSFNRTITIDWDLCHECSVNRKGVTPFTLACYIYHALHTLNKSPEEVFNAIITKWDSLVWRQSPINITIWNKLFNNSELSRPEWGMVLFPLNFIDTIYTNITSTKTKHKCHPIFLGTHQHIPTEFLICTDESYQKTFIKRTAIKITAYRYGYITGNPNIIQGLRKEVSKVIIPF